MLVEPNLVRNVSVWRISTELHSNNFRYTISLSYFDLFALKENERNFDKRELRISLFTVGYAS